MISVDKTIVVEGKYDKIKLESIISSPIITTDGFSVFNDDEKKALLKRIALKTGIIILTDSDNAGFMIRNYLADILPKGTYSHVYIPEIQGKEKRKDKPSAQGLVGVEGVSAEVILSAFNKAGIFCEEKCKAAEIDTVTLFSLGLSGGEGSRARRSKLLKSLSLPSALSSRQLVSVLNILFTKDEFTEYVKGITQ